MRFLDTTTGHFVEKDPVNTKYAVLSHTWDGDDEQTYKQLREIQKRYDTPRGSPIANQYPFNLHTSSNTSGTATMPLSGSTSIPNESTPLLPDRLNLLEQGIPRCRRVDSESHFIHLQRLTLSLSRRLWDLLVLLIFVWPRCCIQAVPSLLYNNPSSTPLSAQHSDHLAPDPGVHHPTMFPHSIWDDPELSPKIREACATARANGYQYIWIDSCCIDQSSSSELSEAINSMYAWYAGAHVCYAYLADVFAGEHHRARGSRFRTSRWFRRGWTLQELIAPLTVVFLSKNWTVIGPRHTLCDLIEEITGISEEALLHLKPLNEFSVAQRLSWAAHRKTTRIEDQAYSLLGIFDLNMPTLYGEGRRAIRRLQEEIMQRIPDQSLFAWGEISRGPPVLESNTLLAVQERRTTLVSPQSPPSLIADAPHSFRENQVEHSAASQALDIINQVPLEYMSCPYGIRTQLQMIPLSLLFPFKCPGEEIEVSRWYLAVLRCKLASQLPGYLLGRVCYTTPSDSGIEFLSAGSFFTTLNPRLRWSLITLSPEIIEQCRPQLKVVYISHHPHRNHWNDRFNTLFYQPQRSISLLLLTANRNALRTKGYGVVDFHSPDKTFGPTGHSLILSNGINGLTITIKFQHNFKSNGDVVTMDARVTVSAESESERTVFDSTSDSDGITISWTHRRAWCLGRPRPDREGPLILHAGGVRRIIMNLALDFVHLGVYRVCVDICDDDVLHVSSPSPIGLLQGEESGTLTSRTDMDVPREAEGELDGGHRGIAATSKGPAEDDGLAPAKVDAEADANFDAALEADGSMQDAGSPDPEGGRASAGSRAALGRFAFWRSQRRRQGKSSTLRGSGGGR